MTRPAHVNNNKTVMTRRNRMRAFPHTHTTLAPAICYHQQRRPRRQQQQNERYANNEDDDDDDGENGRTPVVTSLIETHSIGAIITTTSMMVAQNGNQGALGKEDNTTHLR